jgi:hypothetical protein
MPVPPNWPASLPQFPKREAFNGGPLDTRANFAPEYGPPILRARTTAIPRTFDATFRNLKLVQVQAFQAFIDADLGGAVKSFSWRDPVMGDPALWKILGNSGRLFDLLPRGADLHDLSMKMMRLPGTPWWAPYVRPGASVVPQVVADWNAGVYGIGGSKVLASALPAVTGTFNVYSVSSTDVETYTAGVVITAGGIPATAPALTKRRIYFTP